MSVTAALKSAIIAGILTPGIVQAEEAAPVKSLPCFPGAYYRKAVSSIDNWTGIEGIVTLPQVDFDKERLRADGSPKDNASVYIGGRFDEQEIDAGVTWAQIKDKNNGITKERIAFRPFWRNDQWYNAPSEPDYYYYPGDVIRMKIETVTSGKLMLRVDLLARAKDAHKLTFNDSGDTSVSIKAAQAKSPRNEFSTVPTDALTSFTVSFDAPGFSPDGLQEFKRVNAIDMFDNEGTEAAPTKSRVTGSQWHEVYLLKGHKRYPLTTARYTDMRCPDPKHVKATSIGITGEKIDISGN